MKPFLFTAIKTGRYTHEKKTRDIKEVKRLQEVEKLKAEGRYHGDQEAMVDVTDTAELERIVKHITDVHKQHTPHTPEFFAKLPQKEKEFLVRIDYFVLLIALEWGIEEKGYWKTLLYIHVKRTCINHMFGTHCETFTPECFC